MTEKPEFKILQIGGQDYETLYTRKYENRREYSPPNHKKLFSLIPGLILKIAVQPGKKVQRNDPILTLEAMKMQNAILSPVDGKIKAIHVQLGAMVTKGALLVEFE